MRKSNLSLLALFLATPLWAAGHAGGMGHGATVSAAAHTAHAGGLSVGSSVRDVARSNSQGATHASATALQHVQNSPGKASSNSVLGTSSSSITTGSVTPAAHAQRGHKPGQ